MTTEIQKHGKDATALCAIFQSLTITMKALVQGNPDGRYKEGLIASFKGMLSEDMALTPEVGGNLLADGLQEEQQGSSSVSAFYVSRTTDSLSMHNMYKETEQSLKRNVSAALPFQNEFVTLPYLGMITKGPRACINKSLSVSIRGHRALLSATGELKQNGNNKPDHFNATVYRNGAVQVVRQGIMEEIGVLPLVSLQNPGSSSQQQSLRQWIRAVTSSMYRLDPKSPEPIYMMLAIALRSQLKPAGLDPRAIVAYQTMGRVMLQKQGQGKGASSTTWLA